MDAARILAADLAGLDYDPIPVLPGTKKPMVAGYTSMPAPMQWAEIGTQPAAVGLRAGGPVKAAFLDCDEAKRPGTFDNVKRYLAGLGYMPDGNYPIIQTRSGVGRHIYVSFRGGLPGHIRNLAADFGAGEFRFGPAAIVVAAGSEGYTRLEGDLRQLPKLEVADVLPILQNKDTGEVDDVAAAILATAPSDAGPGRIGRGTWRLLRGEGLDRYPSRSEHEAAIVAGLVNAGLSFGAILALFQSWPCAGKFAELQRESPQRAAGYLRHTWENAVKWTTSHASEGRKRAFYAILWAQETPWPGRTGRTDFTCFVAHALTAYTSGKVEYNLSQRELAERAGIGRITAHKANARLTTTEFITRVKGQHDTSGVLWRLCDRMITIPHRGGYEGLLSFCQFGDSLAHDAFRHRGLGKSAAQVWALLRSAPAPMTAGELAEASGRNIRTVYRVLAKMGRIVDPATGEIFRLVEPGDGDTWRALDGDLDAIAKAIGTAGRGERQKAEHARQRSAWKYAIERQRSEVSKL